MELKHGSRSWLATKKISKINEVFIFFNKIWICLHSFVYFCEIWFENLFPVVIFCGFIFINMVPQIAKLWCEFAWGCSGFFFLKANVSAENEHLAYTTVIRKSLVILLLLKIRVMPPEWNLDPLSWQIMEILFKLRGCWGNKEQRGRIYSSLNQSWCFWNTFQSDWQRCECDEVL